jgi:uncharacterized protein with HEPN domain
VSAREWRLRAEDILEAIARIQRYTAGLSFADFETDDLLVDAGVRNLIIIGEAARNIPPEIETRHRQIPGLRCAACAMRSSMPTSPWMPAFCGRRSRWTFRRLFQPFKRCWSKNGKVSPALVATWP